MILFAATVDGRWRPGIGDPTVLGWATVVAYFTAAAVCGLVFQVDRRARRLGDRAASPPFWLIVMLLLVFLGINKQLDLQTLLTDVGRRIARAQGWYDRRRGVQVAFIIVVGLASASAFGGFAWLVRRDLKRRATALAGVVVLLGFVMIRASSFVRVDDFVNASLAGVRCNAIMELGGVGLTTAGAFIAMRPRKAAAGASRPTREFRRPT